MGVINSWLGHELPISVNDRMISPFCEGFIFTKLPICEVSRKWNPCKNFWIYSITVLESIIAFIRILTGMFCFFRPWLSVSGFVETTNKGSWMWQSVVPTRLCSWLMFASFSCLTHWFPSLYNSCPLSIN